MSYYCASLIGLRETNEDKHNTIENINGDYNVNYNKINYYAIFDGHGGNFVSTYLSNKLYKYFLNKNIDYNNLNLLKKYIKKIFQHNQEVLFKNHKLKSFKTGSTALITILNMDKNDNKILYIINLGDCRAILCNKNNNAVQLSEDHKPNTLKEKERIRKLGGEVYFDGYDYRIETLSVSRAFGDFDTYPYISCKPDIYKIKINKKDKFILLACDGLWDVMNNQEVVDFVLNNMNNKYNISKKLAQYAIDKGSTDNISIIIKFL